MYNTRLQLMLMKILPQIDLGYIKLI